MRTPRSIQKQRDKEHAILDRKPWVSEFFDFEYDDSDDFPWALKLKTTGRIVSRRRRKFVLQQEAAELDTLINEAQTKF